ncbi:hypothetical protein [Treponema sp. R6D11]
MFIPLQGESADGHQFIDSFFNAGCADICYYGIIRF